MTMDGGRVIKSAPKRAAIYSVTATVVGVLTLLGVVRSDELDASEIADVIVSVIAVVSLVIARLNVWLRKPQLPPASPPH